MGGELDMRASMEPGMKEAVLLRIQTLSVANGEVEIAEGAAGAAVGRWVCVDFANTVVWRAGARPIDWLADYDSLLEWAEREGILPKPVSDSLKREASRRPVEAQKAFDDAVALREAIYRILFAVANKVPREREDIALLNSSYREAISHKRLAEHQEGFTWAWEWEGEQTDLGAPMWRIAQSAANLLTSDYVRRLKSCPGEGCAWLFVDTTRSARRRWCEMQICGNRAKVRRHRHRAGIRPAT